MKKALVGYSYSVVFDLLIDAPGGVTLAILWKSSWTYVGFK